MDGDGDGGYGQEYNYSSQDPYSSGGYPDNSRNTDDKIKDNYDEPNKYKDYDEPEIDKKRYEETDLNEILPDIEETHPDGAIPRLILTGLGALGDPPEKPPMNGDLPSSNLLSSKEVGEHHVPVQDENNGCGSSDCMYYTIMCCECSIL